MKVIWSPRQRSVSRSTATAPLARGLAGATIGRPRRVAASTVIGHSVVGQQVLKRQLSPAIGSVSISAPAGTVCETVRSGGQENWAIAIEGMGAR